MTIQRVRLTSTHCYFWGSIFSNFHPCRLNYNRIVFSNSEQAFMYAKAIIFKDLGIAQQIIEQPNPKEAKALGRQVKNFDKEVWDSICLDKMIEVLKCKFTQNESLKKQLLEIGSRMFVEGSPFDTIYGVGLHWTSKEILNENNWKGKNLLGIALKEVQKYIIENPDINYVHSIK